MVLIATDGGLCPLLQYGIELILIQILVAIAEGHLVDDVEPQRVSQFVEARFTRIVRGADVVHRSLLHQAHVLQGQLVADDFNSFRVGGMTCDTTQLNRLSVEFQDISVYRQLTETKLMFKRLKGFALLHQLRAQGV